MEWHLRCWATISTHYGQTQTNETMGALAADLGVMGLRKGLKLDAPVGVRGPAQDLQRDP
jgi:hypothetical protein